MTRLPIHTGQLPLIFFSVLLRFSILSFLLAAGAANCQFVAAQPPAPSAGQSEAFIRTRPALNGSLENNNGKLRLNLTNNAPREFRGTARLSLGSEAEQREVGQVALILPPQQTTLLSVTNAAPSGEQYTLLIHDERSTLVFYKIAPLKRSNDDAPTIAVTLTPITTSAPLKAAVAITTPSVADEAAQVQVQTRLLADEASASAFLVSFELRSLRPIDGTLAITVGQHQERKPARVHRQAHYKFKLPEKLASDERINYTLTAKDGRVLAKGAIELGQLMADDSVTVSDVRTDRASYEAGETARVTVLLEGKGRQGYRLEVLARDGQGQAFFREEKQAAAGEIANWPEFAVTLTDKVAAPLVFEFRVFDPATGLLFDSGEREIPFNKAKPARRP